VYAAFSFIVVMQFVLLSAVGALLLCIAALLSVFKTTRCSAPSVLFFSGLALSVGIPPWGAIAVVKASGINPEFEIAGWLCGTLVGPILYCWVVLRIRNGKLSDSRRDITKNGTSDGTARNVGAS
jgi:hypothetical protein